MNTPIRRRACMPAAMVLVLLLLAMSPALAQNGSNDAAGATEPPAEAAPADDDDAAGATEQSDRPKPPPPDNLVAENIPWDNGQAADLSWEIPADGEQYRYRIEKKQVDAEEPEWAFVDLADAGTTEFRVKEINHTGEYLFRVQSMDEQGTLSEPVELAAPFTPKRDWFDSNRFYLLWITVIFCGAVIFWISHARKGKPIKVRQIAGLEAVDEAVGRATEMGRPCLFVPGIQDINEIQTIAGLTILSRVARTAAEYDATVEVPTARSLVMTTAREAVQSAYLAAGRPDAYNQDLIYYVTDEQFGYVAYLQGMMVREKPAACFYMGAFYAESLILAETGNSIGAIQVAGTAMPAQLPFFVAACDYTLIGEEFFAASAYLSGSPEELGSLKGQDVGKVIVAIVLVIGVLAFTAANLANPSTPLGRALMWFVDDWLKNSVLT